MAAGTAATAARDELGRANTAATQAKDELLATTMALADLKARNEQLVREMAKVCLLLVACSMGFVLLVNE